MSDKQREWWRVSPPGMVSVEAVSPDNSDMVESCSITVKAKFKNGTEIETVHHMDPRRFHMAMHRPYCRVPISGTDRDEIVTADYTENVWGGKCLASERAMIEKEKADDES